MLFTTSAIRSPSADPSPQRLVGPKTLVDPIDARKTLAGGSSGGAGEEPICRVSSAASYEGGARVAGSLVVPRRGSEDLCKIGMPSGHACGSASTPAAVRVLAERS